MFKNREEAGRKLGEELNAFKEFKNEETIILAIPRGGVEIAAKASEITGIAWDLLLSKKIGLPQNPELAIGAIMQDGTKILNEDIISMQKVSSSYIEKESKELHEQIIERLNKYRGEKTYPSFENKNVILMDDGIATGFTIKAAIKYLKNKNCNKVIIAVPVAPPDTLKELEKIVDKVICIKKPINFMAVGQFYLEFDQTTDDQVIKLFNE